ncbi:MAG: glycogen debranching protein GlgX [Calditrichaeota bacterium]|nr:glycogen debranching protein GlgX [Calditrichota bacterium]
MPEKIQTFTDKKIANGFAEPQGATITEQGVNFAVYSQYAEQIFLLLFDKADAPPTDIISMPGKTSNVWHVLVHGVKPGQLYAFKATGKYDPKNGFRFNPHKCLLDPYARAITGKFVDQQGLLFAFDTASHKKDLQMDERDNTLLVPKAIVTDENFDWQMDKPPAIPFEELIIYEAHLKGFTAHKSSQVSHPGTYLGFIEKIPHLQKLGVNAVELLPIFESHTQHWLRQKKLVNYWGYDSIGFFAPESSYSTDEYPGCQTREFKMLVRELHKAGIEVILDVVYNHTGEENELGPTICFRGIDNQTYYALEGPANAPYRFYRNNAGTGNILNIENPQALRFVLDSLRYWVNVMHVDGFRFDLATILGYQKGTFQPHSPFFEKIKSDPALKNVKLIAEPWDLTTYQLGNFPPKWAEWNDKFRDTVRRFVRGDEDQVRDLAYRISGSEDIFGKKNSPCHSINFITAHDGFTLRDLFSYEKKHNEANGENNRDGMDENFSCNCGVEGVADDAEILDRRKRLAKNAVCCLLFSIGTPMISGGDEFFRTQRGNNNAYCQDNDLTHFDWNLLQQFADIFSFFQKAIRFRKQNPIFRKTNFFTGLDHNKNQVPDIKWYDENLHSPDWNDPQRKILCYLIDAGESKSATDDYLLFFILNSDKKDYDVKIPNLKNHIWRRVIDTGKNPDEEIIIEPEKQLEWQAPQYPVRGQSVVVLKTQKTAVDSSYFLG